MALRLRESKTLDSPVLVAMTKYKLHNYNHSIRHERFPNGANDAQQQEEERSVCLLYNQLVSTVIESIKQNPHS